MEMLTASISAACITSPSCSRVDIGAGAMAPSASLADGTEVRSRKALYGYRPNRILMNSAANADSTVADRHDCRPMADGGSERDVENDVFSAKHATATADTTDEEVVANLESTTDESTADESGDEDALDELRAAVEEKYDFENFGPADMAKMTPEEWEAAFDVDTWITGPRLLDRVEADLKNKVASRDIFAVIERDPDGSGRLLAYSDEGYAVVSPDGTVEGQGGMLRDVEPLVAMCSIEEYEIAEPPADYHLPSPESVPEQTGEFGNLMIQIIAGMQLIGGLALVAAFVFRFVETLVAPVIGGLFAIVGFFLFLLVANARLSDRFRAEQYRNRLRAVEMEGIERPNLPPSSTAEDDAFDGRQERRERETEGV